MKLFKDYSLTRLVAICFALVYGILWASFNLKTIAPIILVYFAIVLLLIVFLAIPKLTKFFFVVPLAFIVYLCIDLFSMTYSYLYYFYTYGSMDYLFLIFFFFAISIFNLLANIVLLVKSLPLLWRKQGQCNTLSSESFLMPGVMSIVAVVLTITGTITFMPESLSITLFIPLFLSVVYFFATKLLIDYVPPVKENKVSTQESAVNENTVIEEVEEQVIESEVKEQSDAIIE